jgi:uncharacterized protein (TIGR00730 family)
VYCASSAQIDPVYFQAAEALAHELVNHHITVVFGGGATGLMGRLADTVIARKGHIVGIMPHFMREVEWAHKQVEEFHFTEDMHERKKRFLIDVDAIVALPGGCGTMEELFEVITLKRLGLFTKPIIILNTNGYYNLLDQFLQQMVQERFMGPSHAKIYQFVDEPSQVIPAIQQAPDWGSDAIRFAAVR